MTSFGEFASVLKKNEFYESVEAGPKDAFLAVIGNAFVMSCYETIASAAVFWNTEALSLLFLFSSTLLIISLTCNCCVPKLAFAMSLARMPASLSLSKPVAFLFFSAS